MNRNNNCFCTNIKVSSVLDQCFVITAFENLKIKGNIEKSFFLVSNKNHSLIFIHSFICTLIFKHSSATQYFYVNSEQNNMLS